MLCSFIYDNTTNVIKSVHSGPDLNWVTVPAGCTLVEGDYLDQPLPDDIYDPSTGTFTIPSPPVPDLLQIAKNARSAEMRRKCDIAITGSFNSSALGSAYLYPASMQDQSNMQRIALSGGSLWCYASGTWSLITHTASQGVTVLGDFGSNCDAMRTNLSSKLAAINAATTVSDVNAIVW